MLFLYLLAFCVLYKVTKAGEKPTYRIILLLYISSIICACCLWYIAPDITQRYNLYLPGIIYHILVLILMLLPLRHYDRIIEPEKISISYSTLRPFLIGLTVFSIISIISSFIVYFYIYQSGVSVLVGRMMSFDGEKFTDIIKPPGSILSHISCIASEFSYLAFFFAFFIAYKFPSHRRMIKALLISSLAAVFFQLEWFGRENIVRFFLDGAIVYIIFKPYLSSSFKKTLKKSLAVIIFLFGIAFSVITLGRFGEDSAYEAGPLYSIMSYFGQGFYYFSPIFRAFEGFNGSTGGRRIFAIFFSDAEKGSIYNTADSYSGSFDIPHNVFGTYVCSFVSDLGSIPALIPFFLLIVFFVIVARMKSDNIFTYIYILWIYRFFTQGVFYWVDIWVTGDRLLCFFMVFMLNILYNNSRKSSTYLKRQRA